MCLSNRKHLHVGDAKTMHGPAAITKYDDTQIWRVPVDTVLCVRCLVWPSQAADWPTRRRNYGWPDSATVLIVFSTTDVMWLVWHIVNVD